MILSNFMKAVKNMPTAPSARRIIEISFHRIIKWEKIALRSFRFWLLLQLLLKNFFDSTSLSLSRSKIKFYFFGEVDLLFNCFYYFLRAYFCVTNIFCIRLYSTNERNGLWNHPNCPQSFFRCAFPSFWRESFPK